MGEADAGSRPGRHPARDRFSIDPGGLDRGADHAGTTGVLLPDPDRAGGRAVPALQVPHNASRSSAETGALFGRGTASASQVSQGPETHIRGTPAPLLTARRAAPTLERRQG